VRKKYLFFTLICWLACPVLTLWSHICIADGGKKHVLQVFSSRLSTKGPGSVLLPDLTILLAVGGLAPSRHGRRDTLARDDDTPPQWSRWFPDRGLKGNAVQSRGCPRNCKR
jgi:hypothetical protein